MTSGDHRDKSAEEVAIEQAWREKLIQSATTEDFGKAYDELHSLFLEEQGAGAEIYGSANPRHQDRARQVILRKIGSGHRVLEVGCGEGETSRMLAQQGNSVVSIDVSSVALQAARDKIRGNSWDLQYQHGDARDLRFPEASFDFVVSEHFVEHLSVADMLTHLEQVRRVLKPGGCYLILTPSRLWNGRRSVGFHLNVFTLEELCAMVRRCGFRPTWLETRFLRRFGFVLESDGLLLRLAFLWERILNLVRIYRWPLAIRSRVLPTVMVCAMREK
jgi:2-polyprenyl-3-methyl-5-hydroxy-6-metoxy-1,4-benzoquinol methylase